MKFISGFFTIIGVCVTFFLGIAYFDGHFDEPSNERNRKSNSVTPSSKRSTPEKSYEAEPVRERQRVRQVTCSDCDGSGTCSYCHGQGGTECFWHDTDGSGFCDRCKNTGIEKCPICYGNARCTSCAGKGYTVY